MTLDGESEFGHNEEDEVAPDYEKLKTEVSEIKVTLEESEDVKTLSEAEEETVQKTDIQSILKALTPKFPSKRMNDILQPILVSRIFPDNYLDLNYLLTVMQLEDSDPTADVDFLAIVTGNQAATSIAYEGRHIGDLLEMGGVAHEEEMEKLSKELGL